MFFYLLCVILLTASPKVECKPKKKDFVSWPDDCENHPLAINAIVNREAADKEVDDSEITCTLEFLAPPEVLEGFKQYDDYTKANGKIGEEQHKLLVKAKAIARPFCETMLYGRVSAITTKKDTAFTVEQFQYCPDGEWTFGGNCYKLNKEKLTKEDAKEKCKGDKSSVLMDGIEAAHWLQKLHVFENSGIDTVWMRDPTASYIDQDVEGEKSDHAVYRFRTDFDTNHRAGYVEGVKKETKHASICIHKAKQYLHSYKEACEIIEEAFKIPSVYLKGTCYTQSTSLHSPNDNKQPNELISVDHFHNACSVLGDATSYAVAPTSRVKREGMRKLLAKIAAYTRTKNDIVLVPGRRTASIMPYAAPEVEREKTIAMFEYVIKETQGFSLQPIFRYVWNDQYPRNEKDVVMTWGAVRVEKEANGDGDIRLENTANFVRGRLVCANGFVKEDIDTSTCPKDWAPSAREEGNVICHKPIQLDNIDYSSAQAKCKEEGGPAAHLSPIQSYREQLIVTELAMSVTGGKSGSAWIGATRTGEKSTDFKWDMDDQPMDYNNWASGEPNNKFIVGKSFLSKGKNIGESCVQMYLEKGKAGTWNDIPCDRNHGGDRHTIVAGVCAKPAISTKKKNS